MLESSRTGEREVSGMELYVVAVVVLIVGIGTGSALHAVKSRSEIVLLKERLASMEQQEQQSRRERGVAQAEYLEAQTRLFDTSTSLAAVQAAAERVPQLEGRLEERNREFTQQSTDIAILRTQLDEERKTLAAQRELLDQSRATLTDSFKALSSDALRSNNQSFLELAKATLEKFQEGARCDLDARHKAVNELVQPLRESLQKVDVKLGDIETARVSSYSALNEQLKGLVETHLPVLRNETANLVKALRQPTTRGRWGELQLKRVVELAGMIDHCDFLEQENRTTEDGKLRPDLVIKLPGGRNIVVDAKAPVSAYLEAIEATDEPTQRENLARHAQQVRAHMTALGRKAYWDQFEPTPEFVVMFLPGEVFFSAALQEDPSLIESGVNEKVIVAAPTTLIALLRAVAYGWRQEALAQNAKEIAMLGKDLYSRIITLAEHWNKVGERLGRTVEAYNKSTGSLETSVLRSARKLRDLKVSAEDLEITELDQVEKLPRMLQAQEFDRQLQDEEA
jgi:DNA recombination protein RmuC